MTEIIQYEYRSHNFPNSVYLLFATLCYSVFQNCMQTAWSLWIIDL